MSRHSEGAQPSFDDILFGASRPRPPDRASSRAPEPHAATAASLRAPTAAGPPTWGGPGPSPAEAPRASARGPAPGARTAEPLYGNAQTYRGESGFVDHTAGARPWGSIAQHDPGARPWDPAASRPEDASAISASELRAMAIVSFRRLSTPMQRALWWTCIDPVGNDQLCRNLGVRPGEAMALELRAWLQVRQEWLAVAVEEAPEVCREVLCALGPYAAGTLSATDTARCEAHFGRCDRCPILVDEFIHLTERLAQAVSGKKSPYQVPTSGPMRSAGGAGTRGSGASYGASSQSDRRPVASPSEHPPRTRRARREATGW